MMQTAWGEHARGARVITSTILAIATAGHYQTVARLEATENLRITIDGRLSRSYARAVRSGLKIGFRRLSR
jgi:hypothetical protein